VAIPQDRNGLPAGIYARTGRGLDAVFFYARNVRYPRRTRLLEAGQRVAGARLNAELQRAIAEHMARLAGRSQYHAASRAVAERGDRQGQAA
jgi:hypothetical protein